MDMCSHHWPAWTTDGIRCFCTHPAPSMQHPAACCWCQAPVYVARQQHTVSYQGGGKHEAGSSATCLYTRPTCTMAPRASNFSRIIFQVTVAAAVPSPLAAPCCLLLGGRGTDAAAAGAAGLRGVQVSAAGLGVVQALAAGAAAGGGRDTHLLPVPAVVLAAAGACGSTCSCDIAADGP